MIGEIYVPTDAEKAEGRWSVVLERVDEDGDPDWASPVHIIPTFGKHHDISMECWCKPTQKPDDKEMWIHTASQ